jgi:hypothetical protein
LSGYRASTKSHQTAPHPPLQAALPPLYGSINFTHLKENFSMVELPYIRKKNKGKNLYGWGTIKLSLNHLCKIGFKEEKTAKKSTHLMPCFLIKDENHLTRFHETNANKCSLRFLICRDI